MGQGLLAPAPHLFLLVAQISTLHHLNVQITGQRVIRLPTAGRQQAQPHLGVIISGLERGRLLGLVRRRQIQLGKGQLLSGGVGVLPTQVKLVNHHKQPTDGVLLEIIVLQQQLPNLPVRGRTFGRLQHQISRLLHPVMDKAIAHFQRPFGIQMGQIIGRIERHNQLFHQRGPQLLGRFLRRVPRQFGQQVQLKLRANTRGQLEQMLHSGG